MDSIITVRLDSKTKENASRILRKRGMTPSSAVQLLFNSIVEKGDLPFENKDTLSKDEIKQRMLAFNKLQLSNSVQMTDEEIKYARIRDRYDIDVR